LEKIGFFEVCCREKALDSNSTLFEERAVPFDDQLANLQALSVDNGGPLVFTICCACRFLCKGDSSEMLLIPRDVDDTGWMEEVGEYRIFNIEKKSDDGDIAKGDAERIFDMFLHNANADKLFGKLNVSRWIVYGVGIDLCVSSAAKGLLRLGYDVTILTDVLTSNAEGTPESMREMLDQLCEMGATTTTYSEFIRSFRSGRG